MRKLFRRILILLILPPLVVLGVHQFVALYSANRLYTNTDALPQNEAALVLGTSKYIRVNGKLQNNLYYRNRLNAAKTLYEKHKVKKIIVSGHNSSKYYNEPDNMRADLQFMGVDSADIIIDNYGLRTFDSVIRSKEVFGQNTVTIVSQKFHNERAICIAKFKDINAIAYNADDVPNSYGPKVYVREIFARCKMLLDLISNKKPERLDN